MTRKDAVMKAANLLRDAGIEEALIDARYLFFHVTGLNRTDLLLDGEAELSVDEEKRFYALVSKRCERIPLQHLTGEQEFMGLDFYVSSDVLIPRQDTECLVEEALKYSEGRTVLDMCTGSGCIAISIAKLGKAKKVIATDLSVEALKIAEKNASRNEVEIAFYQGDLFEAIHEKVDILVSNPPYIRTDEIEALMPEVKDYEPYMALCGDDDGLLFYRRIINDAAAFLNAGGRILFEIGCEQAEAVTGLLAAAGYEEISVKKDYAGLDRVVSAKLIGE